MTSPAENSKCAQCGKPIPEAVAGENLCVVCRYGGSSKPAPSEPTEYEVALDQTPGSPPCLPPEVDLLYRLEEAGVDFPDRRRAVAVIEAAFDDYGDCRAGQALCMLLAKLPGARPWTALRLALGRGNVAAEARRLRIAPQILHRTVAQLRKRMIPSPPIEGHGPE